MLSMFAPRAIIKTKFLTLARFGSCGTWFYQWHVLIRWPCMAPVSNILWCLTSTWSFWIPVTGLKQIQSCDNRNNLIQLQPGKTVMKLVCWGCFPLIYCDVLPLLLHLSSLHKKNRMPLKKIIYDHWRTGVDLLKRVLLQYHGWDGAFHILMDVQEYFRTSSSKCSWNPMLGYLFAGVRKCPNWTSPNYWEYKFQQIFEGDVQNPQEGTFTDPVLFSVLSLKNNLPMGNSSGNWC